MAEALAMIETNLAEMKLRAEKSESEVIFMKNKMRGFFSGDGNDWKNIKEQTNTGIRGDSLIRIFGVFFSWEKLAFVFCANFFKPSKFLRKFRRMENK